MSLGHQFEERTGENHWVLLLRLRGGEEGGLEISLSIAVHSFFPLDPQLQDPRGEKEGAKGVQRCTFL